MGYRVKHKSYGEGTVKSIRDGIIEVEFGNQLKKFQFPKAFGPFLATDDPELMEKVRIAKESLEEEKKKAAHDPVRQTNHGHAEGKRSDYHMGNQNAMSLLLGDRAKTIYVGSDAEMFELVGYMAAPGRVSSFEAEVPKDGRDKAFESLFPGQIYRPITMGDTPSGLPNKMGPQFRINFADVSNCPDALKNNMGQGNGSCVGRINKSRFVLDLVLNYGFQFGSYQNTSQIKAIAKQRGYLKEFEKGYNR